MNRTIHYIYIIALLLLLGAATPAFAQTIRGNVYGGGNLSQVVGSTTINIKSGGITAEKDGDGNIYGGGYGASAVLTGNTTVNVTGGTISKDVYGGGALANVTGSTEVNVSGGTVTQDIYGGGALANVSANTSVNLTGGTIRDSYGGGLGSNEVAALIGGDATTTLNGSVVNGSVFGCNNLNGTPQGHAKVHILSTTPRDEQGDDEYDVAAVYGGGNLAAYVPSDETLADAEKNFAEVLIENCDNSIAYVYGGGNAADVPATNVTVWGGTIGNVFGGGHGDKDANPATEANVTGNASVTIKGGTIEKVFAGSNSKGSIGGNASLNIAKEGACGMHITEVYGGGNQADGKAGAIEIGCTGSDTEGIGDVYGGANAADITNAIELTITGGHINRVFGGNNASGSITGPITVNVDWDDDPSCDQYLGDVFGGGNEANYSNATTVNMKKGTVNNIYGGGNQAGIGTATVNMSGGNVLQGLYGGCNTSGTVTGDIAVTVTNGTIGTDAGHTANVHGGGYGSATATNGNVEVTINQGAEKTVTIFGDVYGGSALGNVNDATDDNTTVTITAGTVNGNVYGGGLGDADNAAQVNGDVLVSINGGVVNGSVFGCNNTNGTPKGHVKVHVTKTTPREGQTAGQYDVPAVYGGGNKAAYEPTSGTDFAEVLIENCDNSIEYVYGGGNAAPVPATDVKIYGADAINHAFAGGNGAGVGNQGADVGYLEYTRDEAHKYGTGTASIAVYGGTVHNVYGGSNTLGYIREKANVSVENGGGCPLKVDNVFGGGNEAPMDCGIDLTLSCTEGADVIYAGANNADVNGNINVKINSGTYRQFFGGNNTGGAIRGHINVEVEETGCTPIIIKELFGCGNNAAYSVYGYEEEGGKTKLDANGHVVCKTSGDNPYDDPTINVISCTAIGTIYGGGLGEAAKVYGNPKINVDMVKGKFAGKSLPNDDYTKPIHVIKNGIIQTETSLNIPNAIGIIGNIFGGGKEAAVYGNTTVNVCVQDANKDANIAPLPEEFITFGLEETNVIDYNSANRLPSTMTWEGTTGGLSSANIHMNKNAVDCINFNDSYNNASTKNQLILAPVGGFKSGDKVTIAGFYNHNNEQTSKVSLFDGSQTLIYTTGNFINGQLSNEEPNTFEYTLTADTDRLFVRRGEGSGTKTYVTKLVVTGKRLQTADVPSGSIYGGGKLANVYGNTKVHIRNGSVEGNVFGAGQGDANQPDAAAVSGKTEVIIGEE